MQILRQENVLFCFKFKIYIRHFNMKNGLAFCCSLALLTALIHANEEKNMPLSGVMSICLLLP